MKNPDEFDDLYKAVRDRLAVEAYALTGDQHVARTAVRDAFVVAAHRWSKVQPVPDKEAWLRPLVWSRARHRHTARPWHREKDLPAGAAQTLEALSSLPMNQRKALVLAHLPALEMTDLAREIGLPLASAEEQLRIGTAAFAKARGVSPDEVGATVAELRAVVQSSRWPRGPILRRAGTARRRTHTVVGVLGTVVGVVLSGMVVAQGESVEATLEDQGFDSNVSVEPGPEDEDQPALEESLLLDAEQVTRFAPALAWTELATHDNTEGNGLVLPCQVDRFADPDGLGAFVRTFEGLPTAKKRAKDQDQRAAAVELVELSRDVEQTQQAYAVAHAWFAGCADERTQLLSYYRVKGVGEEAALFVLRSWKRETRTFQIGVARSGQTLIVTSGQAPGLHPDPAPGVGMLAASLNSKCGAPGLDSCASEPKAKPEPAPKAGIVPGMLSEFDLPPVPGAPGPWVGTDPERARVNFAATRCDESSFTSGSFTDSLTRTFLFPEARRSGEFGLTETVGVTRGANGARQFVAGVRSQLAQCAQEGFGTEVTRLLNQTSQQTDLTVWHLEFDISDERSLQFLMAIVRHGKTVSQVGFVPGGGLTISRDDFTWVSRRALERLPRLRLRGR